MKLAMAILMTLASCGATPGPAADGTTSPTAPPAVSAELVADTAAVSPGSSFRLGVLLTLAPGWHVYWKNPGDSGMPISIMPAGPNEFRFGEVAWPLPERFTQPGDIVGYGYTERVLLPIDVAAPKEISPRSRIRFTAEVRWLSCKDVCVPGKSALTLEIPVDAAPKPVNTELFAAWRERLPLGSSAAAAAGTATVMGRIDARTGKGRLAIEVHWTIPPARVEFFPEADPALGLSNVAVTTDGARSRVEFDAEIFSGQRLASNRLPALLVFTDARGARRGLPVVVDFGVGGER